MTKTKLSNDVGMLHVYIDKMLQVKGARAIRERKKQEQKLLNLAKFKKETK